MKSTPWGRLLAWLGACALAVAAALFGTPVASAQQGCPSLYVINANGTTQQGPGAAEANSFRGQAGTVVLDSPVMPDSFDASTNANSAWVQNTLAELDRTCPGTPKRVIGWSAAAEAAGNGVNGYAQQGGDNSEVTLHTQADPRRAPGPDGHAGVDEQLPFFLPGITMDGARDGNYGGATHIDECNSLDPVCHLPELNLQNIPDIGNHVLNYPAQHPNY